MTAIWSQSQLTWNSLIQTHNHYEKTLKNLKREQPKQKNAT